MSTKTIMLAKQFDIKHVKFPCVLLEKLDGVACRFDCDETGFVTPISRQGKGVTSADLIAGELEHLMCPGDHIVGELYIQDVPFKDISGTTRRQEPSEELNLYIYDAFFDDATELGYNARMKRFVQNLSKASESFTFKRVKVIPVQYICHSADMLREFKEAFFTERPDAEGLVLRNLDAVYEPGKRSWGMQKIKFKETVDLKVLSVEEAISKAGEPLGMVGRINCEYKDGIIGVGPGALLHLERFKYFRNPELFVNKIIEVEYMPDVDYKALREPRFKRLRDDKSEPNEELNAE